MREKGLFDGIDDFDFINHKKEPNHPSPVIRIVAIFGDLMGLNSAQEFFFAVYLSNHSEAKDIEFPDKNDLKERIENEQQKNDDE
jgi:hypothetical protein